MDAVVTAVAFIVVLGVLVLIHELGHFLTARLFGIRVEEFGIGFPPRVFPRGAALARRRATGRTVYSLNALPLGGFVRMAGENGVTDAEADIREAGALSLSGTAARTYDEGAFANKPAWQRAVVLLAGVFNNMLLAIVLVFATLALIGTPRSAPQIVGVAERSPAARAGLAPGDIITRVGRVSPNSIGDVSAIVAGSLGRAVPLEIKRAGRMRHVQLVPRIQSPCGEGPMGVMINPTALSYAPLPVGDAARVAAAVPVGVVQGLVSLPSHLQGTSPSPVSPGVPACASTALYMTFNGRVSDVAHFPAPKGPTAQDRCLPSDAGGGIAGPVGIMRILGCEANAVPQQGWEPFLLLVAELSATLAVINVLPIPALDGGRLLFVLISAVSRRRVRPDIEAMAHAIGMALLLSLIFARTWTDVLNWFSNKPVF